MKITVFAQDGCKPCTELKMFLGANDFDFEVKDIGIDEEAKDYLITELGAKSTPVLEIRNEDDELVKLVFGFDADKRRDLADFLDL